MNRSDNDDDQTVVESGTSGPPIKLIALLILVIGIAVFFFQNLNDAPIEFLWMSGNFPIWVVIGASFFVGAIVDRLAAWQWNRSRRRG
ncbi:MAG TPA: LapA family protein [Ilumatobacter sp.]|nr:LapA family protein [Ilumatobacter sp.]